MSSLKGNFYLKIFGAFKVPMIGYVKPKLISMDTDTIVVKIPLSRRTKNHLDCMYFGALCVGADLAGGFIAANVVRETKRNATYIFKDMTADFLKRAEGDVIFTCRDGKKISKALEETFATGERVNVPVLIEATVPDKLGQEVAAKFQLTLSLKSKEGSPAKAK